MTKKTVFRDSTDGKFVTERYADKHPRTTERERVPSAPAPAHNRSSGSGRFVSDDAARRNPSGTQREKK